MQQDGIQQLREALEAVDTLIGFTASGRRRNQAPRWERITIRPVELRGAVQYQFAYFDGTQDITKNYGLAEVEHPIEEILAEGFSNFHAQSEDGDLHVRITKRGKVLVSRGRPSVERTRHQLTHNRPKRYLLTPENGRAVLHAVGILDAEGRVKPTMQPKYRQVNAFLKLLEDKLSAIDRNPIRIVDCGCGSAFLTLSAYAYLAEVLGREVSVEGVDRNARLIQKCEDLVGALGWEGVSFRAGDIGDFVPADRPDIVLSLHACDTATDEALARAVAWEADLILAAPCCQQELAGQVASEVHRPVLRHGILKQRTADILTDAMRAQLLRLAGYGADVIEFISSEETSKNLMIRAEKQAGPARVQADVAREYLDLKFFWGVEPCLERLLRDRIGALIDQSASAGR